MRGLTILCTTLISFPAFANGFDRPIPQAQSATAEVWYGLACLALVVSMIAVQRLVSRR
ncbi:protein NnrT [uncultured Tateyamaria sp.]|uniref:protein NnrT n=1 Tax=uncultured Tateyamaria sp. TaxID=455651 RepID=UPI0026156929|nr:protein NnrT [uncultured Tateyamaria sp.]